MTEHHCPTGVHEPGDRSCASNHGCRCEACRRDHADYNRERDRRIGQGRWEPFVDGDEVREHVRALRAAGMGTRTIAARAGVSRTMLVNLEHGDPRRGQPPTRRVTAAVADRLRSLSPDAAPGAPVDAAPYLALVRMLITNGWTQRDLATKLGMWEGNFSALLRRRQIRTDTARRLRDLAAEPSPGPRRHRLHAQRRQREVETQRRRAHRHRERGTEGSA